MFGLFSKKPKGVVFDYITYVTKVQKYKNVLTQFAGAANDRHVVLIYFFDSSRDELFQLGAALNIKMSEEVALLSSPGYVLLNGRDLEKQGHIKADQVIFMEAHPIASMQREAGNYFLDSGITSITCYVGLDEALFQVFGGSRIANLLEKMGVEDDEPITHTMVTKSIETAQEKLEKDHPNAKDIRSSQEAWLKENGIQST
ncbi:MAG: hypothetical protein RIF33_06555 [Cyclobacteriaceae bacterium]